MTTTTKFGLSLLNSCPKKCPFRYDLIWCKSAPCGFLSSSKQPLRKHEMIYVFYEKLPFYDLSSHKHKFIKERNTQQKNGKIYEGEGNNKKIMEGKYDPPLPTSLIKENNNHIKDGQIYNGGKGMNLISDGKGAQYNPPLPTSLVKEETYTGTKEKDELCYGIQGNNIKERKNGESRYDPPLPTSLVKEDKHTLYGRCKRKRYSTYNNL